MLGLSARENVTGYARQNVSGRDHGSAKVIREDLRGCWGCLVSDPRGVAVPSYASTETKTLWLLS